MLDLVFKSFIDGEYIYEYYPEGKEEFGTVGYNINTGEMRFITIASSDLKRKKYAGHAVQALRRFAKDEEFPKEWMVAWG